MTLCYLKYIVFGFVSFYISWAQSKVKIGIFDNAKSSKIVAKSCKIIVDSSHTIMLNDSVTLNFSVENNKIKLTIEHGNTYRGNHFTLINEKDERPFNLFCKGRTRYYPSDLFFSIEGKSFNVIQITDVDTYLEGVLQAEMGHKLSLNSYKAQAIISRTYVYANMQRHESQGYNICNEQHCQVYVGTDSVPNTVKKAIETTTKMVLKEPSGKLVNTVFHANCGGYTANSEDIWISRNTCLRGKKDPYCSKGKAFKWYKEVSLATFLELLKPYSKSGQITTSKDETIKVASTSRKKTFTWKDVSISYETLRSKLGVRTGIFSILQKGDKIAVEGRGFGHGVGLCQEGAIEMGKRGMSYKKILSHYYQGSRISEDKMENLEH